MTTASEKTRGDQAERHVCSFLFRARNEPARTGPQITFHRGSPTYTVFFLSHVTCHPFQVRNQRATKSSPHIRCSEQDTGHIEDSGGSRALVQGVAVGGLHRWSSDRAMSSLQLGPTRAEGSSIPGRDTTRANHHHRQSRTASRDTDEMTDLGNCSHQGDPSLDRGFILWFDISSDRLVIISLPLAASPWPFRPPARPDCQKLQRCITASYIVLQEPTTPSHHEQRPWHHLSPYCVASGLFPRGSTAGRGGAS